MNRRATTITLLILLLILLLVAQSLLSPPKIVKRPAGRQGASRSSEDISRRRDIDSTFDELEAVSASEERKPIVEMVNNSGIQNPLGYYEVFGQVQNIGFVTARNVRVKVTFRDSSFEELALLEAPVDQRTLIPGQRSNFKVTLPDKKTSSRMGSYVALIIIDR